MIINPYFLIAGILAFFFAVGHAAFGQIKLMGDLESSELPQASKHAFFSSWHQWTLFNFICGVTFLLAATTVDTAVANALVLLIMAIDLSNLFMFVGSSFFKNKGAVKETIPQIITMFVYVSIMVLGMQ